MYIYFSDNKHGKSASFPQKAVTALLEQRYEILNAGDDVRMKNRKDRPPTPPKVSFVIISRMDLELKCRFFKRRRETL